MAVESRFVVIRHGVEAKTFMDKKSADEYDKMLDMADNLAEVFAQSPITLTDSVSEELSIYLAQNREDVLVALLAKKAPAKAATKPAAKTKAAPQLVKSVDNADDKAEQTTEEKTDVETNKSKAAKPRTKTVKPKASKESDSLSEAG